LGKSPHFSFGRQAEEDKKEQKNQTVGGFVQREPHNSPKGREGGGEPSGPKKKNSEQKTNKRRMFGQTTREPQLAKGLKKYSQGVL